MSEISTKWWSLESIVMSEIFVDVDSRLCGSNQSRTRGWRLFEVWGVRCEVWCNNINRYISWPQARPHHHPDADWLWWGLSYRTEISEDCQWQCVSLCLRRSITIFITGGGSNMWWCCNIPPILPMTNNNRDWEEWADYYGGIEDS